MDTRIGRSCDDGLYHTLVSSYSLSLTHPGTLVLFAMSNADVVAEPALLAVAADDATKNVGPAALQEVATGGTATTNGHAENGAAKISVDDEEDNEEPEPDVPDEEENLFITLEEQEKEAHLADPQPKAVEAAPRLLQTALKEGQVQADESEEEEEAAEEAPPEPHVHKRVRGYNVFEYSGGLVVLTKIPSLMRLPGSVRLH